jgi:Aldehyde dehydrogenase family
MLSANRRTFNRPMKKTAKKGRLLGRIGRGVPVSVLQGSASAVEDGDSFNLDQKIGMRQTLHFDRRTGRQRRAEDLRSHFRISKEQVDIGDVGCGPDEIGQSGARFGGHKQSGWGREMGLEGLLSFTEVKAVVANLN